VVALRAVLNVALIGLALGMTAGGVFANLAPVGASADAGAEAGAVHATAVVDVVSGPGPFRVGQVVRSGVGVVQVTDVVTIRAVTPPRLLVTLRVTNDAAHSVQLETHDLLLRDGEGASAPASALEPAGAVPTGATVVETVTFAGRDGDLVLVLPGTTIRL
jgi:hypothetical protein